MALTSALPLRLQEELPAVAEPCAGAARGVAAANAEVEAGRAADHPKLAELRSSLLGFRALHPVHSRVLDHCRHCSAVILYSRLNGMFCNVLRSDVD